MSAETSRHAELATIAAQALELARVAGATASDVMATRAIEFEVKVADGEITTLTQATSKGLGLRVFVDGRLGFCTTSDFAKDSLARAVERAVALAREAAHDPHNGLADVVSPAQPQAAQLDHELDLYDPAVVALPADQKIAWAHELERAARAADPRVVKFRDSGVTTTEAESVLATSTGVERSQRHTSISAWCNPIAEAQGELQSEVWYDSKAHLADLESIENIGRQAGKRAARMLGARRVATQNVPVIFEPDMAAGLVAGMIGALNGDAIYKRASFLLGKLGESIAAPLLSVIDDPLVPRGLASAAYDGEGLMTTRKRLVDAGVLTTYLYDAYTARKAGATATASAQRRYNSLPSPGVFNFYVAPGRHSLSEIIGSCERAFIVTRGLGSGVNAVTGEYSRGANGLWVEHGEIVYPVQEATIAGDYLTMLADIDRVGDDFAMHGACGAPTLRIATMTVSGGGAE